MGPDRRQRTEQRFTPARTGRLLATILLLTWTLTADAHRMRAAITTVLFNDRTGRIEVMHRFYLHDAEHAVSELVGHGADLFGSTEDRQRFAVYVHEHFSLQTPAGLPLPLELIGAEIEDDSLWVYEAVRYPAESLNGLGVSQRALQDFWPDQVNTVNVERGDRIQTLTFRVETPVLALNF